MISMDFARLGCRLAGSELYDNAENYLYSKDIFDKAVFGTYDARLC